MTEPAPPGGAAPQSDEVNVVPLGAEAVEGHGSVPPPSPPSSRLHGMAIAGMALSALLGIGSMLTFVTIRWEGSAGRYIVAVVIVSAIGFLASASAAVFTAARDTYARRPREEDSWR